MPALWVSGGPSTELQARGEAGRLCAGASPVTRGPVGGKGTSLAPLLAAGGGRNGLLARPRPGARDAWGLHTLLSRECKHYW